MSAFAYKFNNQTMTFDLADIRVDDDAGYIASAIKASLFTDRRDPASNAGGCWSDMLYTDSFGSLLWTKRREKITPKLLVELEHICREALTWIVAEGHAAAIDVAVERATAHGTMITITTHLNNGQTYTQREPLNLEII
jgi:phage gp46-like protein